MSVILIRAGHTLNPRIQGVHDPNARSLTQSLNFYSRDSRIFPPNLQTRPMKVHEVLRTAFYNKILLIILLLAR